MNQALKIAKANFKELKKNPEKYNASLNEVLTAFSKAAIPNWGGLVFNGQRV